MGSNWVVGGNPYTTNTNINNKSWLRLKLDILSNESLSSHNCHGLGQPQCNTDGYRDKNDNLIMQPEKTIFELNQELKNKQ